jgi:hypothetical protein
MSDQPHRVIDDDAEPSPWLPGLQAQQPSEAAFDPVEAVYGTVAQHLQASSERPERSYGCTYGCGAPYDYVLIDILSGETEFLDIRCFLQLAAEMLEAVVNPNSAKIKEAMAEFPPQDQTPMRDGGAKSRGHNAPATNEDPDLLAAYDSVITADELPDEFK